MKLALLGPHIDPKLRKGEHASGLPDLYAIWLMPRDGTGLARYIFIDGGCCSHRCTGPRAVCQVEKPATNAGPTDVHRQIPRRPCSRAIRICRDTGDPATSRAGNGNSATRRAVATIVETGHPGQSPRSWRQFAHGLIPCHRWCRLGSADPIALTGVFQARGRAFPKSHHFEKVGSRPSGRFESFTPESCLGRGRLGVATL